MDDTVRFLSEQHVVLPSVLPNAAVSDRAVRLFSIVYKHGTNGGTAMTREEWARTLRCSVRTLDRTAAELRAIGCLETTHTRRADGTLGPLVWRTLFPTTTETAGGDLLPPMAAGDLRSPVTAGATQGVSDKSPDGDLLSPVAAGSQVYKSNAVAVRGSTGTTKSKPKGNYLVGTDVITPPASGKSPVLLAQAQALVDHLSARMVENGAKPPSARQVQKWQVDAERLLRLDGRNFVEAQWLIDWCQDDDFWRGNILSMGKFREKYHQLSLKAAAKQRPGYRHRLDRHMDAVRASMAAKAETEGT